MYWTKVKTRILLAEELFLDELDCDEPCDRHILGDEIAAFILKLPERFNDRKIKLDAFTESFDAHSCNAMIGELIVKRLDLVFKDIRVSYIDCRSLTNLSNEYLWKRTQVMQWFWCEL